MPDGLRAPGGADSPAHMGYSAAPFDTPASSEIMDDRRKKLLFRAWRRGFREIDLILGGFADRELPQLGENDLEAFERLLDAQDQAVYAWITEQEAAPPAYDTPLLTRIRAFRFEMNRPAT